jgi:LmbE family N-acetylglucosaminyl deacetylase
MAASPQLTPHAPTPPERALVVMAHPDDIEFTCGGTVAKLADAGCDVSYCLVTSGDKGSKDASRASWDIARGREVEQEAAARVLGVRRCIFLRWPDGFVEDQPGLRGQIVQVIREQQPDLVITWDPERGFNHRDHRTVGQVTVDAVFPLARTPHYFREQLNNGLAPHRVNELLLAGTSEPDYFVDVSEVLERRANALQRHASQISGDWDERSERWRTQAERAAVAGQVPWAEGFRRILLGERNAPNRKSVLAATAEQEEGAKSEGI